MLSIFSVVEVLLVLEVSLRNQLTPATPISDEFARLVIFKFLFRLVSEKFIVPLFYYYVPF